MWDGGSEQVAKGVAWGGAKWRALAGAARHEAGQGARQEAAASGTGASCDMWRGALCVVHAL